MTPHEPTGERKSEKQVALPTQEEYKDYFAGELPHPVRDRLETIANDTSILPMDKLRLIGQMGTDSAEAWNDYYSGLGPNPFTQYTRQKFDFFQKHLAEAALAAAAKLAAESQ